MIRKPTIHRMDRRSVYKNYMLPGIYHITVKATEKFRSPFGKVVEQELLHSIAAHYPMVEVQDYVIMPEHMHFIVEVKRKIVNKQGREAHLGQVIAGYKKGCNRRYWELTGQMPSAGELLGTRAVQSVPDGSPNGSRPPSNGSSGRQPLFATGYCDVMPVDAAQLEQQRAYIKGNPRSRLMRSGNREWLYARRGGIDTAVTPSALYLYLQRECASWQCTAEAFDQMEGWLLVTGRSGGTTAHSGGNVWIDCDSYGNRGLLERKLLPVVCHRADKERRAEQRQRCIDAAAKGAVLVSPRIHSDEQAIMDEVVNRGFPVILVADNGFLEVYHPSTERIERCAEGGLLIVTPWKYHYRRKDEGITVMECKTMNCVAQALCRLKDDWWKMDDGRWKRDDGRGMM